MLDALVEPVACRYCALPSYLVDADGGLHPCCKIWIEDRGRSRCVACEGWASNNARGTTKVAKGKPASRKKPALPPPTLRAELDAVVPEDRDLVRLKVLVKLQRAAGLWVGHGVLVDLVGPDVTGLLLELVRDGFSIQTRPSPLADESQYRVAP